jgi:DNA damage-binding protein 1
MISLLDLSSYACEPDEEVISVSVVDLAIDGNEVTYFAVGTMAFVGDEVEPSAGRILLFEAGNQRSKLVEARGTVLTLKVAHMIEGPASAITCLDGVLVVAKSCLVSNDNSRTLVCLALTSIPIT